MPSLEEELAQHEQELNQIAAGAPTESEAIDRITQYMTNLTAGVFPAGFPAGMLQGKKIVTTDPLLQSCLRALDTEAAPPTPSAEVIAERPHRKTRNQWDTTAPWKGSYGHVFVMENPETGRVIKEFRKKESSQDRLQFWARTLNCRVQFTTPKAEIKALESLVEILTPQQRHQLLTADAFVEVGRSGVWYMLRRNRPTLALRPADNGFDPLCALCMHPLAYYEGTWAGGLPPSDELKAHLMYIRADEHFYWRKCNQIPIDQPNSGV